MIWFCWIHMLAMLLWAFREGHDLAGLECVDGTIGAQAQAVCITVSRAYRCVDFGDELMCYYERFP